MRSLLIFLVGWAPLSLLGQSSSRSVSQCALPSGGGTEPGLELVRYCAPPQAPQRSATVQFLVDDSGSMAGFTAFTPRLFELAAQSISQLRDLGMAFPKVRTAYFSAGRGIHDSLPRLGPGPFHPRGQTILHEAVASSRDYDLTLILTDGVAASGAGDGDCAGGVDAACAARALRLALTPRVGEPQTPQGGLFVTPLVGLFQGTLFTEQILPNAAFDEQRALASVQADTSTNAEFKPAEQSEGRLVYGYAGPRALFFLVIARQAETGRALTAALASRAANAQIQRLRKLKEYVSDIAMLPPVEVFPGAVPPVAWAGARIVERNYRPAVCGVVDLRWQPPGTLRIDCPGADNAALTEVTIKPDLRSSQCVDMAVLPQGGLQLAQASAPLVDGFVWRLQGKSPGVLLKLRCRGGWKAPCDGEAPVLAWTLRPDYRASADRLAGHARTEAVDLVWSISTDEPAHQPVRTPGFAAMLEKFYRETAGWRLALPFARLQVCKP